MARQKKTMAQVSELQDTNMGNRDSVGGTGNGEGHREASAKKIVVVTTFPDSGIPYAQEMIKSFCANWPVDVPLLVHLDQDSKLVDAVSSILRNKDQITSDFICVGFDPQQKEFIKRNKDLKAPVQDVYRFDYVKFSHKVFAIDKAAGFVAGELKCDYLIWLDADVITNQKVTYEDIVSWLPNDDEVISYLGRKDWEHSECGFMGFRLNDKGLGFIKAFIGKYLDDSALKYPQWHDSYIFDRLREEQGISGKNLTDGLPGRDIFDVSPLAKYMTHLKGNRKKSLPDNLNLPPNSVVRDNFSGETVDLDKMIIQTQNCVNHDIINQNVMGNLKIIKNWLPKGIRNDEEIVICSAGPSLDPDEIRPFYERGVKIVSVKHALNTLLEGGIVPWACILLDPRQHVEGFVKNPHPAVNYFVASMCAPEVAATLLNNNCRVFGYHAAVGAGEHQHLPQGHFMISGGSATSTRGISLLKILGFRKFHLFGYDLCSHKKPDLQARKENGRLIWEEVTLTRDSWGNRKAERTFWTKGEFLAQVQEFDRIYLPMRDIELHTYGDGIIPWSRKHKVKHDKWQEWVNNELHRGTINIDEFIEKTYGKPVIPPGYEPGPKISIQFV